MSVGVDETLLSCFFCSELVLLEKMALQNAYNEVVGGLVECLPKCGKGARRWENSLHRPRRGCMGIVLYLVTTRAIDTISGGVN